MPEAEELRMYELGNQIAAAWQCAVDAEQTEAADLLSLAFKELFSAEMRKECTPKKH